jgi:sortase A
MMSLLRSATVADLPQGSSRILWTIGHLLMLVGVYLFAATAGVYSQISYQIVAAQGGSELPLLEVHRPSVAIDIQPVAYERETAFLPPRLTSEQIISSVPAHTAPEAWASTISRIEIPSIAVDSKVVEVGWELVEQDGQQFAIWEVAEFAVGHHMGSANPREDDNIVLAAHVGGYGKVFRDLYYVQEGDEIALTSNGVRYHYRVHERMLVDEEGAPEHQRQANAALLEPTGFETLTLITCWPLTGPQRFSQRVIVRATPLAITDTPTVWTIR